MSSRREAIKHVKRIGYGVLALSLISILGLIIYAGIEFVKAHPGVFKPLGAVLGVVSMAYAVGWMIDDQRKVSEL